MKFKELGLDHDLLKAITRAGFEEATPIQAETIPLALAGKDVIGQAQTGTGKTAAFGLPVLQDIDFADRAVQTLVISPTRELAIQTQEELYKLGRDKKKSKSLLYMAVLTFVAKFANCPIARKSWSAHQAFARPYQPPHPEVGKLEDFGA